VLEILPKTSYRFLVRGSNLGGCGGIRHHKSRGKPCKEPVLLDPGCPNSPALFEDWTFLAASTQRIPCECPNPWENRTDDRLFRLRGERATQ
jgi:hypothetical protein